MENKNYLVILVLGDWSEDGHGKMKEYFYNSNYDAQTIRQAYKDSCKLTKLQFNYNEDYTGGLLEGVYGSPRQIFTEYGDSYVKREAINILKSFDLNPFDYQNLCNEEEIEEDEELYINVEGAAKLIMDFIKLSMPKDWNFNEMILDSEPINGYWNPSLNVQFGYGLFD